MKNYNTGFLGGKGKIGLAQVSRSSFGFGNCHRAPMAEAMSERLGMDAVYGCGPIVREGLILF